MPKILKPQNLVRNSEGDDANFVDTFAGHRFGDNKINASKGDDQLTGNGGADKFQYGKGKERY